MEKLTWLVTEKGFITFAAVGCVLLFLLSPAAKLMKPFSVTRPPNNLMAPIFQ